MLDTNTDILPQEPGHTGVHRSSLSLGVFPLAAASFPVEAGYRYFLQGDQPPLPCPRRSPRRGLAFSDRELILKAGSDGQSGCGVSPLTETPILGAAVSWCAGFVPPA